MASKSYIIGLGLAEGFLTVEEAAQAAHVEVQSQIERWGEVEDSKLSSIRLSCLLRLKRSFLIQPTMWITKTSVFV